jgi:CRP-like cAMP-binding protein
MEAGDGQGTIGRDRRAGMDQQYWFLKSCPLFEQLPADDLARLESRSLARTFARGSLIYLPSDASDHVLLLTSGRVKLYHLTSEGKQAVLALVEPGDLFGELAVYDRGPREEFAEAMESSTVVKISGDEIRHLMASRPDVSLGVTRLMGLRRRRIERRLKALLFRSNRERLVHLLLELAETYGRRTPAGVEIEIRLSHQELASIIGSTRETVTVLLGELQAEGSLTIKRRQLVLIRVAELAASVDVPVPAEQRTTGEAAAPPADRRGFPSAAN